MSLEVLGKILELGGPGYVAMTGLVLGGFSFLVGASMLILFIVAPLYEVIRQALHAIGL